jgi:hypothetical protein
LRSNHVYLMTIYIVDVAKYQVERPDPLDLQQAVLEGFSVVNIKVSGGNHYVSPDWAKTYAEKARGLGMGVCTFHWLDNTASGAQQADIAYQRITEIDDPKYVAHQVDCEDTKRPATWRIWRDYVNAMQDKLGRNVLAYTGDWYWNESWNGVSLTPYLWAAPNDGYLATYPGDSSRHWIADYGGWAELSIMQYAVSPISGTGNCSKSAIRDYSVWRSTSGTEVPMAWRVAHSLNKLLAQINDAAPARSTLSDGSIGNDSHCPPGYDPHNPPSDHCPDELGIVRARDFTHDPGDNADMNIVSESLRVSRDSRIKYVIWNGRIFSATNFPWIWRPYSGSNPHDKHMHVSVVSTSAADNTADWEIGIEMADVSLEEADKADIVNRTGNRIMGKTWPDWWSISGRTLPGSVEAIISHGQSTLALLNESKPRELAMETDLQNLSAEVSTLRTEISTLTTMVTALTGMVQALTDLVSAGGGNLDTAAILAKITEESNQTDAAVASLQQQITDLQVQVAGIPDAVADEQRQRLEG